MPLGAPEIVSPVSTCSRQIRVRGQFTGARVRLYIDGDPTPVADAPAGWSDATINVDQSRLALAANRRLRATQEFAGETSDRSAAGTLIEKAVNAPVTFADPLYFCAQSVFLTNCIPGAKIQIWQAGSMLGSGDAIGDHCWVNFAPGRRIVAGSLVDARQTICTSPTPLTTASQMPVNPVPRQTRRLASPTIVPPLRECQELVSLSGIVSGAVVRLTRGGTPVWDASVPLSDFSVIVGRMAEGEEFSVTQSMPLCEIGAEAPSTERVEPLTNLDPPSIEGPVCSGVHKVKITRLVPPAVLRVFADGAEIGRWQAGDVLMEPDMRIPAPATLTARQELCGIESPMSRPYPVASGRSGRWFVVEDRRGGNLQARAFAIHVALARTGKVVIFSGDQHNPDQNAARPQDIDHCELFDAATFDLRRIDAPTTDVFCCGHALLPDGRLLVAGGTEKWLIPTPPPGTPPGEVPHHVTHFPGLPHTWIFSPTPDASGRHWSRAPSMQAGRWYPTLVTLPGGQVLALSGHPQEAEVRHNNNSLEIFSAAAWVNLGESPDIISGESDYLYPRVCVGPTGGVFSATPLLPQGDDDPGRSGTWTLGSGVGWTRSARPATLSPSTPPTWAGSLHRGFNSTGVLLPLFEEDGDDERSYRFQFLLAGEPRPWIVDLGTPRAPATPTAWTTLGTARRRENSNLVLLPSGEVLLAGGVSAADPDERNPDNDLTMAVRTPEMLVRRPGGWAWETATLATASIIRNYHSTALLLPDGRIFTGGGNKDADAGGEERRRLEIELYEPWYFCAPRPRIIAASKSIRAGQRILVDVRGPGRIERLALIRCGSSTHGYDPDQRYIGMLARPGGEGRYIGVVPPSIVAIPGYYLLFAVTDRNIPSKGVFIQVRTQG